MERIEIQERIKEIKMRNAHTEEKEVEKCVERSVGSVLEVL